MAIAIFVCIILFGISVFLFLEIDKLKRLNYKLKLELEQERKNIATSAVQIQKQIEYFENIANRVIKQQREDFNLHQKEALDNVLSPFRTQVRDFRDMIEKTNHINKEDKGELKRQLDELKNLNFNLSQNALDLTTALKGNNKVQGDWGEHRLKTVLDLSGLIDGIDYSCQVNIKGDEGKNIRPDCIINLPDGKKIVVDAKVSISNYLEYIKAEGEDKKIHLDRHVESIKNHVKELSKKEYYKYVDGATGDFVFMFIPNEHAFIEALRIDNTILDMAYKSNVAITTPASILPIFRIVRNLWNIERQNQNASLIAQTAGKLYDKLATFVDSMRRVDKGISSARGAYDEAIGQLSDGRGSALSIAEDLKTMGAKASKQINIEKTKLGIE